MVQTIKESATRVLKEQGLEYFTTNRVAELAGVSIGSLYQYFGSKEVLIAEIKREHFSQLRALFADAYQQNRSAGLHIVTSKLIEASIQGHLIDPELHRVLSGDLSAFGIKEDDASDQSIRQMIRTLLRDHSDEIRPDLDIDAAARIIYRMVEDSVHSAVVSRHPSTDFQALHQELSQAVGAYLGTQQAR